MVLQDSETETEDDTDEGLLVLADEEEISERENLSLIDEKGVFEEKEKVFEIDEREILAKESLLVRENHSLIRLIGQQENL